MKRTLSLLLTVFLLLAGCAAPSQGEPAGEETLSVVATTYPVYLLACEVARDVEGVTVTPLVNQAVSCLHDYSLTVNDMKALEGADLILLNGVGLEDFMDDALEAVQTPRADCSQGIELLAMAQPGHVHQGEEEPHDGDADPHIWLDPVRACQMVSNISQALSDLDPDHSGAYSRNAEMARGALTAAQGEISQLLQDKLTCRELITFHDGFAYFADAFGLDLLYAIEEEEGSEATAQEIAQVAQLVRGHELPAIFTEVNGSNASAQAIARETGAQVYPLSLLMSGPTQDVGVADYTAALRANADTLVEALG